mmetsp:Transcript_128717/g.274754  ORF Transcript_128717/g.274754 Transcript_128717/m.274754 type:complete len:204 (-) Transcript_128717:974-1585(-)
MVRQRLSKGLKRHERHKEKVDDAEAHDQPKEGSKVSRFFLDPLEGEGGEDASEPAARHACSRTCGASRCGVDLRRILVHADEAEDAKTLDADIATVQENPRGQVLALPWSAEREEDQGYGGKHQVHSQHPLPRPPHAADHGHGVAWQLPDGAHKQSHGGRGAEVDVRHHLREGVEATVEEHVQGEGAINDRHGGEAHLRGKDE